MARLTPTGIASLAVLAGALLFGVVLGFVLAFGSSESPSFEERWAELGVPEAEFVFGGDFTPAEEASARRDLKVAQVVLAERFGVVTSDLTVYVLSNDLFEDYEERVISVLGKGHGFEPTCGIVPPDEPAIVAPKGCPETRSQGAFLAHEYFRVLQREAGGLAWRRQVGTVRQMAWLDWIEAGSAVYATALVSDAKGQTPLDVRRDSVRAAWAAAEQPFPRGPADLADPAQESFFAYDVGFLATEWLVERAGPEAVLDFFRFGGHSAAFEAAFGMTLDEFHAAFEEHRLEVASPLGQR